MLIHSDKSTGERQQQIFTAHLYAKEVGQKMTGYKCIAIFTLNEYLQSAVLYLLMMRL